MIKLKSLLPEETAFETIQAKSIASMTGLRVSAILGYILKYGLDIGKINGSILHDKQLTKDLTTAISGKEDNAYSKKIIKKFKLKEITEAKPSTNIKSEYIISKIDANKLEQTRWPHAEVSIGLSLYNYVGDKAPKYSDSKMVNKDGKLALKFSREGLKYLNINANKDPKYIEKLTKGINELLQKYIDRLKLKK